MSSVGFYRYKGTITEETTVSLTLNGVVTGQKTLKPLDFCTGDLAVKYLDSSGQYRFYVFNRKYETTDRPTKIGGVNKFLTNLLTDQTSEQNVGYKNTRQISATAKVSAEALTLFKDIYASPRVFLYIGDGTTDLKKDWLEVEADFSNPIVKLRKGNEATINAIIKLPEHYTITLV